MRVTFLVGSCPLTKTISRTEKSPYPHIWRFKTAHEKVTNLDQFQAAIESHGALGHCLLKGECSKNLDNESRAGATDRNKPTTWVCLDVDGADFASTDAFLDVVGLKDLDCVVQYSASHGLDKALHVHVFAMLTRPATPGELKTWLKHLNLSTALRSQIKLNRACSTLRWPLDVSTCQNDKLVYIAPPIFEGKLKDPVSRRVIRHTGSMKTITLPDLNHDAVEDDYRKLTNMLRKAMGLRANNKKLIDHHGVEILPYPGRARVTGERRARGFVYLNINGGDSWGYYHPDDNAEIIYNFKGEPNYFTKDFLPDYYLDWKSAHNPSAEPVPPSGEVRNKLYLAFRDQLTDQYYYGTWNQVAGTLELHQTSSLKKLNDAMVDLGELPLENVPSWNLVFDPAAPLVDVERRQANLYQGGGIEPTNTPQAECPPTVLKLIQHVLDYEEEAVSWFLNWLAAIWQTRSMTTTAWVLSGTFGTGKGLLYTHVIAPLFGQAYCPVQRLTTMANRFNSFLERSLFVLFDESRIENTTAYREAMEALKSTMVTSNITIERKYANQHSARIYANFLIASNYLDSVHIPPEDRRFSVGRYQKVKLKDAIDTTLPVFVNQLTAALPAFARYLADYPVDIGQARDVLRNEAREQAIDLSMSTLEEVTKSLREANLEKLLEYVNMPGMNTGNQDMLLVSNAYRSVMIEAVKHASEKTPHKVTKAELRTIVQHVAGNAPDSEGKLTRMLKHHDIHLKRIRIGKDIPQGLEIKWKISRETLDEWKALAEPSNSKVVPIKRTTP